MTIQAPTKRIALFVNPLAGKGNALRWRERAEAYLRRVGIAYQVIGLDYPPDLDAFTDVVIAGGDGTINHILNHYPNIRLPIGVIPGGTGNDLALAFDRGMNPEGCLETAVFG
jgi:diacylglycerol kinase (ATP)